MVDALAHRGPDGQSVVEVSTGMVLGHRRLSIIDLSPENDQPFAIDDGNLVLTYNGEIYNYIELRRELQSAGHRFATSGDTEVVLRAYKEWGGDCVRRFNGMWALAIFDRREEILFCSRDRFGVKPFYYNAGDGSFAFASEAKALLAAFPALAQPNMQMVSDFLRTSRHSEGEQTFFEGILRLQPAHNLVVKHGRVSVERFWDYPVDSWELSPREAAARVLDLLEDSVRLRLRSDVPIGSLLSSGLDSSTIVTLVRELSGAPHDTFTASFPGHHSDEARDATSMATELNMTPHSIGVASEQLIPTLQRIVHHLDAPTQCAATLPLWNIMRDMGQHVVVALDGQGADELFGGYTDVLPPYVALDLLRERRLSDAVWEIGLSCQTWGWRTTAAWTARSVAPSMHRTYRRFRGDEEVYQGLLHGIPDPHNPRLRTDFHDRVTSKLYEQHAGGLRTLLQYSDAVSMAHSVEARLPYLDYRLVELGFRLPGHLKVARGRGKAVLRDAMKSRIPPHILDQRRKLGFATPLAQWFREHPDSTVRPVLDSEACRARGLFNQRELNKLLDTHISGRRDLSSLLLRWITVELWFQHFIDRAWQGEPLTEVGPTDAGSRWSWSNHRA